MKQSIVVSALLGMIMLAGCGSSGEKTQEQLNEELRVTLKDKASLEAVRSLIAEGADVNAKYVVPHAAQPDGSKMGFVTPLTFPVANGTGKDLSIIKELVDNGADASVVFDDGTTLLHMAVLTGRDGDVIRYLAESGAPVNAQNAFQQTPLFQAVYNENADEITALIESGADPKIKDADGQTIFEMIETYQKNGSRDALQNALSAK